MTTDDARQLRFLFAHTAWSERALDWHQAIVDRHRDRGWDVRAFCVTPDPPERHLPFPELDQRWRRRDRTVRRLQDSLIEAAADCDVLINFNGANIHPAWLAELATFNVFMCFDDPESSHVLSRPVAPYFDFCFTANAACVPLYQSWGIHRADFLPHGAWDGEFDPGLDRRQILDGHRDVDAVFFGERASPWRRERLDRLQREFPEAVFRGRGWASGFVTDAEKLALYRRARIGWNVHNTVGPVNLRTYSLPANGMLEICDNKCRLGSLFDLRREVIGFDTIEECVGLTHYYLEHEDERRQIAAAGFERVMRDYREEVIWERLVETILPHVQDKRAGRFVTPSWKPQRRSFARPFVLLREGVRGAAAAVAAELEARWVPPPQPPASVSTAPYVERNAVGAINWAEKVQRAESGGFLEWPNMVALNWAITRFIGDAKRIVEVGGGTGAFAHEAAADPLRTILCADADADAVEWARTHRDRPNVEYRVGLVSADDGPFDLAVAVDVIEHVGDFNGFLELMSSLAPRAIITTPNRARDEASERTMPPAYYQHVREWTAGEFYWVLRCFYEEVELYSMPDPFVPWTMPITVHDRLTPLIGVCTVPLRDGRTISG